MPKKLHIPGVPDPDAMLRALKEARERDVGRRLEVLDKKAETDTKGFKAVGVLLRKIRRQSDKGNSGTGEPSGDG